MTRVYFIYDGLREFRCSVVILSGSNVDAARLIIQRIRGIGEKIDNDLLNLCGVSA